MSTTAVAWTLSQNGGNRQSLSAWKIKTPQVSFRSLDDDEMSFVVEEDIYSGPVFDFGDQIVLYRNAVTWFQGVISKRTPVASDKLSEVHYVVSGPWWQMSRVVYQLPTQFYDPNSCAQVSLKETKIVLYQDPTLGTSISTGQQITNVIDYCLEDLEIPILIVAGELPAFIDVPMEEVRDLTATDIIRRAMQWTPDGVSWITYNSSVPVFNCQQRDLLSSVTIDLSLTDLVTKFELTPRNDLVPTGVRFNYIGIAFCNVVVPNGCADPSTGIQNTSGGPVVSQGKVQVQTLTQDVAGVPDASGGLIGTIDLTQLTATTTETAPIGMAGEYYLSLITPTWQGKLTTNEQECTGILRPGLVLNMTNGNSAWATMDAQIQQVTESLETGETECTFGPPAHLLPQNFVNLLQLTRRRPLITSTFAQGNTTGAGGSTNCTQGLSPNSQKGLNDASANGAGLLGTANASGAGNNIGNTLPTCAITVCNEGVSDTLQVYCPSPNE